MTRKVKDLAVCVNKYEKDGQTKGKYINIGVVMQDDSGKEFILLDKTFNPAGVDTGEYDQVMVTIFDNKNSNSRKKKKDYYSDNNEDIPF
jgi:hypothetical protein